MIELMRCLVAVVCFSQLACALCAQTVDPRLQGLWFGDGPHPLDNTVLVVNDDRFIVVTPMGAFISKALTNEHSSINEIDIERFDGDQQLGVYEISDSHLRLKLSKSNQPRPTTKDVQFPNGKPHWHATFDRRPTPRGLDLLKKHLQALLTAHAAERDEATTNPQPRS